MPKKSLIDRANETAKALLSKRVGAFIDLTQLTKFTTLELVRALAVLANKQDTTIRRLEDRIRMLERGERYGNKR